MHHATNRVKFDISCHDLAALMTTLSQGFSWISDSSLLLPP